MSSRSKYLCIKNKLFWGMLFLMAGCGWNNENGPQRFDVTGIVTFNNKPVPRGTIVFSPDKSEGNSGPQGAAEIRDGKFDTSLKGKGIVGGSHLVIISGFDNIDPGVKPKMSSDGMEIPQPPLFPTFTIKKNLPLNDSSLNIEIPLTHD
tara:strand:- start:1595 stop:2041 length:447 start_codon:yes stop_codon:yes gene_type:complete